RCRDVLQHVGLLGCEEDAQRFECVARDSDPESRARKRGGRFPASPGAFSSSAGSTGPGGLNLVHRLFGCLRHRNHRYESAAICFGAELDMTFNLGEQSMVGAHADIKAGMPGGTALARDNVAGN